MKRIEGVLAPVITPFRKDYSPDAERFVRHCRWLLAGCAGLAVFGTNSEANSMSVGGGSCSKRWSRAAYRRPR